MMASVPRNQPEHDFYCPCKTCARARTEKFTIPYNRDRCPPGIEYAQVKKYMTKEGSTPMTAPETNEQGRRFLSKETEEVLRTQTAVLEVRAERMAAGMSDAFTPTESSPYSPDCCCDFCNAVAVKLKQGDDPGAEKPLGKITDGGPLMPNTVVGVDTGSTPTAFITYQPRDGSKFTELTDDQRHRKGINKFLRRVFT